MITRYRLVPKKKKVDEADMGDIRQKELAVAQEEFFKLREELFNLTENLTLVQFQKVNEKVREVISSFSMNQ